MFGVLQPPSLSSQPPPPFAMSPSIHPPIAHSPHTTIHHHPPSDPTPLPPKAVAHPCLSCHAACSRRGSPSPCWGPCAYILPSLVLFLVPVTTLMHFPPVHSKGRLCGTSELVSWVSIITSQVKK
ncbi:hypothetical protein GE21DRAFT_1023534 [Neurospora crassa]|nr:hypothetical protein GE21DRAFT_1023534 [Neurospora crassa]